MVEPPRDRAEIVADPYAERTFAYHGGVLVNVHDDSLCAGRACVIHNPSDHHMRGWPLVWRGDGPFDICDPHFERTCPHGIGHPDPDDVAYLRSVASIEDRDYVGIHGCDGCCADA